eukprot:1112294-Prorocentrum_minimum.AAC.2
MSRISTSFAQYWRVSSKRGSISCTIDGASSVQRHINVPPRQHRAAPQNHKGQRTEQRSLGVAPLLLLR